MAPPDWMLLCADVPKPIIAGPLTADPVTRRITKNGVEIPLKNKEYELLLFLMRHPEQVFSQEDLYEMIWGLESMGDNITVQLPAFLAGVVVLLGLEGLRKVAENAGLEAASHQRSTKPQA